MKVLIVEDNFKKVADVKEILHYSGINDWVVVGRVVEAFDKLFSDKFDLIITDLGIPRFPDEGVVDTWEGLLMLFDLVYEGIFVPTIIYSTTDIPKERMDLLLEEEYPCLGQAYDSDALCALIQNYLEEQRSGEGFHESFNSRR